MKRLIASTAIAALSATALASSGGAHWSYTGHDGPEHWGELTKEFKACKLGKMQSPIDLSSANVTGNIKVETAYRPVELEILNNGHTVQLNVGNGSTLTAHGKVFDLLQIHFHTPSKHLVDGKHYPMEAHFVHKAKDGSLAVIGVLYKEGAENAALKPVIANIPMKESKAAKKGVQINPADLLPGQQNLIRYMGSLTTPPCSEGVNWYVVPTPVEASKAQIAEMAKAMGMNARPAQPVNNRLVVEPIK